MAKKATGIVRQMDELGRIVLPMELRRTLDIHEKDPLAIFVNGDEIVLSKYEPCCVFCGGVKDVVHFKKKMICRDCLGGIDHLLKK